MRRPRIALTLTVAGALTLALASRTQPMLGVTLAQQVSQAFGINWHTIDSGGSTSSGGAYTLNGTIGQADAGVLTGGSYTLQGGFWPGVAAEYNVYLPVVLK